MTMTIKRAIPKYAVEVSSHRYEAAWGDRPRGDGTWAFDMGNGETFWVIGRMKFSKARDIARGEAAARGISLIRVCP